MNYLIQSFLIINLKYMKIQIHFCAREKRFIHRWVIESEDGEGFDQQNMLYKAPSS